MYTILDSMKFKTACLHENNEESISNKFRKYNNYSEVEENIITVKESAIRLCKLLVFK